jgi:hypothetical protein
MCATRSADERHASTDVDQPAIPELLPAPERREVRFSRCLLEAERGPKFCGECFGRVAHDWETAALRRAVQRECRDDRLSARLQNAAEMLGVTRTIGGIGEEVKERAIVPQIGWRRRPLSGDISLDPPDRRVRQSLLCAAERRAGDINDRQALDAASDQTICEAGISAPDIDHSTAAAEPRRVEQLQ